MKSTMIKSAVAMVFAVGFAAASMAAPVTAEGTGVGKHGDVIAAVTFDGGRIQALGSHEELLEKSSIYREVYTSQNRGGDSDEK